MANSAIGLGNVAVDKLRPLSGSEIPSAGQARHALRVSHRLPLAILALLSSAAFAAPLKEISWVGCGVSKAAFMQDLATAYEKKSGIRIKLEGGGATRGIRDVASNKSHLGGSCRLPLVVRNSDGSFSVDPAEKDLKMIPLGWDALVAIVHADNRYVTNITEQQIRDIYTGKITNWRELGAPVDAPIHLYARDGKISGVERTLRQLIFNNNNQEFTPNATLLPSSGKIEEAIEKDINGFGMSGISSARTRKLNMLVVNGVAPTYENLKSGSYKYYRLLFLVAGKEYKQTPEIRDFVKFATSMEGQKIIEGSGTLSYMRGLRLLHLGLSESYIQALETIEGAKIYSPGGEDIYE